MAALVLAVLLFFTLVLTLLGDSLAASGRSALSAAAGSDLRPRNRVISAVDVAGPVPLLDVCPKEAVDYVPCEDPRAALPCAGGGVALPDSAAGGAPDPFRWPESLQKVWDLVNFDCK